MAEQMRSATALVDKALSDPQTIQDLHNDPKGTLRKLEAEVLGQLPPPTPKANDAIWIIIVIAFSLAFTYSVWILGQGVNVELKNNTNYVTKSETILTIVMTIVGFLAGLLAPSPVGKK